MRLPLHSPRLARPHQRKLADSPRRDSVAARALLGEHPLVAVLGQLETAREQLLVGAAVHALGLLLWLDDLSQGRALAVGALLLEIGLGCRIALLAQTRRELCLALIVAGHEQLPLTALGRERRRLSRPRHQARLAESITEVAQLANRRGGQPLSAQPQLDPRALSPVAPQLQQIATLLRREPRSLRAIAFTELLLSSPESVLYGSEPDPLRRELGRLRYLLET